MNDLFSMWDQPPKDRIKDFMTRKMKSGEKSNIREIWDRLVKEETIKIVVEA